MITKRHWTLAFWGCATVILVLSLVPVSNLTPSTGWDKSDHVFAFFVLAIFGCQAYPARIAAVIVGLLCYGALIEILQSLTPYRFGEWADVLADGIGSFLGWALVRLLAACRT